MIASAPYRADPQRCTSQPWLLTSTTPANTSTAPARKPGAMGSSSSHAPSATPSSGVRNENTYSREAR